MVILSVLVERFSVSRMQDFFYVCISINNTVRYMVLSHYLIFKICILGLFGLSYIILSKKEFPLAYHLLNDKTVDWEERMFSCVLTR